MSSPILHAARPSTLYNWGFSYICLCVTGRMLPGLFLSELLLLTYIVSPQGLCESYSILVLPCGLRVPGASREGCLRPSCPPGALGFSQVVISQFQMKRGAKLYTEDR